MCLSFLSIVLFDDSTPPLRQLEYNHVGAHLFSVHASAKVALGPFGPKLLPLGPQTPARPNLRQIKYTFPKVYLSLPRQPLRPLTR